MFSRDVIERPKKAIDGAARLAVLWARIPNRGKR
jgi:hypothetical protein